MIRHRIPRFASFAVRGRRAARALALFTGLALAAPASAQRAFVTTTDYSTGSLSTIDLATKSPTVDVAAIHSDATVRWFDDLVYVVNRLGQDNVLRLDPDAGFAVVNQFSTGNGSNPHDVVVVAPDACWVTRYETAGLWKMNPVTGAHTATVDLSAFADADTIPEMDAMTAVGSRLFVTIQRLDRGAFFSPTGTSYVAVVDLAADTLLDVDPATPGVQAIPLTATNPFSEIRLDPWSGDLIVSEVGFFGVLDGGVEAIDPATFQSHGFVLTESAAGGDVLDVVIASPTSGWAIVSTPSFTTELIRFDPSTGTKTGTVYAPGAYVLQDVERGPDGRIYLADRTATAPGIRCYDATTGVEETTAPISTGLPPFDIAFDAPVQTAVGETPAAPAWLGDAWPNPFSGATTLPFGLREDAAVRLEIFDAAGRRVRTLFRGARGAGEYRVAWDGADDRGRPVASGVYFARLVAGVRARAVRKLVLVR